MFRKGFTSASVSSAGVMTETLYYINSKQATCKIKSLEKTGKLMHFLENIQSVL